MYILLTGALIAILVLLIVISLLCYCRLQYFFKSKTDDGPAVPYEITGTDIHHRINKARYVENY